MDMLTVLNSKDNIFKVLTHHIELFKSFKNVYIFGSLIKGDKYPNDIDVLLIYNQYTSGLQIEIDRICTTFDELYGLTFDFTVLSEKEEEETYFISRLELNYFRLK